MRETKMMGQEGEQDNNERMAQHLLTHAYKLLLIAWFVAVVTVREERYDTPSTCPPLLQALACRVEQVLTAMSLPPQ